MGNPLQQVKGLAELQLALDQLPAKIEANIMRGALRAGMKVIEAEAKRMVPALSGELQSTIRSGVEPLKRDGRLVAYVKAGPKGAKRGKTPTKEDRKGWYAGWVEYGTASHVIKAQPPHKVLAIGVAEVQHPGGRKKPFLRPAFDTQLPAALQVIRDYIRKRLATKHGINVPTPGDGVIGSDEGDES